jgi:hypothetical protein
VVSDRETPGSALLPGPARPPGAADVRKGTRSPVRYVGLGGRRANEFGLDRVDQRVLADRIGLGIETTYTGG